MHHTNVVEDHEALIYQTYPCAYYVQSPSTLSHANSAADIRSNIQNDIESAFHSPIRSETNPSNPTHEEEASRFALRRYPSSRGSSHSFLHHNKVSYDGSHGTATETGDVNRLVIVDGGGGGSDEGDDNEDDEEKGLFNYDYYFGKRKGGWKGYFSYRNSDSCAWILLQMSWRVVVSLGVALLVFYIATKPPPPNVSIEVCTQ